MKEKILNIEKNKEDLSKKRRNNYLKMIIALEDANPNIKLDQHGSQTMIVNTLKALDIHISNTTVGDIIKEVIEYRNELKG